MSEKTPLPESLPDVWTGLVLSRAQQAAPLQGGEGAGGEVRAPLLAAEVFVWLILVKMALRFWTYEQWSARLLGAKGDATPDESLLPEVNERVWRVQRAMWRTVQHLPGKSRRFSCLVQSIVLQRLLARRGIPSTLYLGVKRAEPGGELRIRSHAWLRCGDQVVAGEGEYRLEYTEIACFGSRGRKL